MEDDLLADDGAYKDEALDDLDIDAEAALLGLSDEEIDELRSNNDEQELEYVDEDGNPVTIGENNADLYEVANIDSEKLSHSPEEDVLELDIDAELESFKQEAAEITQDSPVPAKSFKDKGQKENVISVVGRKEKDKPSTLQSGKRKESRYSPVEESKDAKISSYSYHSQSYRSHQDSYSADLDLDEESEDESIADDHRERFKSERNLITLTSAKRRSDIPDTLESVISVEETAKVQAFLENEQRRKMRFKGNRGGRTRLGQHVQKNSQNYSSAQMQQPDQYSSQPSSDSHSASASQPRKILINPHFRGARLPLVEQAHAMVDHHQQPSIPTPYEASNYPPPSHYMQPEPPHSMSMGSSMYAPPQSSVPYKPEYPPPPQHLQQVPAWQPPPEIPPAPYSNPPVVNYGDQMHQPPYSCYNQSYPNYQQPPPITPNVPYSQPPPPVQLHQQPYPQPPLNPVPSSMPQPHHYPPPVDQLRMQPVASQSYQEPIPVSHTHVVQHGEVPPQRYSQNQQHFVRPPEKRVSTLKVKTLPTKQPRMEHPQRKANMHVNSSNIREIPLVDSLPRVKSVSVNKVVPIVEDEDEKTKELRQKIEEQKLLREQILKRKEERRRQMAAQRLLELKKRQAEQNKNVKTLPIRNSQVAPAASVKPTVKPSVKERIGVPFNSGPVKKKVVVVRKKLQSPATGPNPAVPVGQRLGLPLPSQRQNAQQVSKFPPSSKPQTTKIQLTTKTNAAPATSAAEPSKTTTPATNSASSKPPTPGKKIILRSPVQNSPYQNRNSQRPSPPMMKMQRLRAPGPRQLYQEQRMPFPGPRHPMNEMRMPSPDFHLEPRPPLLRFHPPGDPPGPGGFPPDRFFPHDMAYEPFDFDDPPFLLQSPGHLRGPGPQHFRGPGPQHFRGPGLHPLRGPGPSIFRSPGPMHGPHRMEPPMFHDRFPRTPFSNQMPPMRPMFDKDPAFARPRFPVQERKQFKVSTSKANAKQANFQSSTTKKEVSEGQTHVPQGKDGSITNDAKTPSPTAKVDSNKLESQIVSVENLSSNTSEAQLKKLCASVGVVEVCLAFFICDNLPCLAVLP